MPLNKQFWKQVFEVTKNPGTVLGKKVHCTPIAFEDIGYVIKTHAPKDRGACIWHLLFRTLDCRYAYVKLSVLPSNHLATSWIIDGKMSHCLVDNDLEHMLRYGLSSRARYELDLDYHLDQTEDEVFVIERKTLNSLKPV